eukprot:SAG31_NODE_2884_length_4954_cov_2.669619_3_plen_157_part_00
MAVVGLGVEVVALCLHLSRQTSCLQIQWTCAAGLEPTIKLRSLPFSISSFSLITRWHAGLEEDATKAQLIEAVQSKASVAFLRKHKVFGQVSSLKKSSTTGDILTALEDFDEKIHSKQVDEKALATYQEQAAALKKKVDEIHEVFEQFDGTSWQQL